EAVTGLWLRDVAALPHAGVHARRVPGAADDAARSLRRHRDHEHRLHSDGTGQGIRRAQSRRQARLPERLHSRGHGAGPAVRPAARRRHRHRDGLRVAGGRDADRRVDPQPGLSGRAVRRRSARIDHRQRELPRRHDRGTHRPAHPGRRVKAVSAGSDVVLNAEVALPAPAAPPSSLHKLWRLKWGLVAAVVMAIVIGTAAAAPVIAPHDPLMVDIRHRLVPPGWMTGGAAAHLLGTDQIGRDLLSRVIYGGRVSLIIGTSAVLVSATIGVLLGLAAGYFAGKVDWTIMTIVNVMLTFPFVLLALAVIAVLGPSLI